MKHDAVRGFGETASQYERGRPGYPQSAVDQALGWLAAGSSARVVDLGAGTGKLAVLLAARGVRVVALEPSHAMLKTVVGGPTVVKVRAVAEELPFRRGSLDGATAATAFHWFDGTRVLWELHRVLRRGARLVLLWNRRDDSVPWVAELSRIVNRNEEGFPRYRHGTWRKAIEDASDRFRLVGEAKFDHVHELTQASLVDRVASTSFVATASEDAREAILAEVRSLILTHEDTRGREVLALPYQVDAFAWERI